MAIVNFEVPAALDRRIKKTIKERGFASKAEFFRMAAFNYFIKDPDQQDRDEINKLTKEISRLVEVKFRGKKIPSVRDQLANLQ